MNVLVTGHRGYVGSLLVRRLAEAGHQVTGLDTGWFEGCDLGPPPAPAHRSVDADVRDAQPSWFRGIDAVIHLAAFSNDPLGSFNPSLTARINHLAASNLARMARAAGVRRFVFASTCSVYGAGGESLLDESSPLDPLTPYAAAKAAAEHEILALAEPGFCPVSLRPGTAYGASPRLRGDLVVNNLLAHALFDGEVLLKSDGRQWRPIVHVEDIARVFVAVLEAPAQAVRGAVFNLGFEGENYRVAELATRVEQAVPGSVIRHADDAGPDTRSYRVDCSALARALPDFQPMYRLADGIADLARRLRGDGVTREAYFGPRFFRLEQVQAHLANGALDAMLRWRRLDASSAS